jgi:hypothetical protein
MSIASLSRTLKLDYKLIAAVLFSVVSLQSILLPRVVSAYSWTQVINESNRKMWVCKELVGSAYGPLWKVRARASNSTGVTQTSRVLVNSAITGGAISRDYATVISGAIPVTYGPVYGPKSDSTLRVAYGMGTSTSSFFWGSELSLGNIVYC